MVGLDSSVSLSALIVGRFESRMRKEYRLIGINKCQAKVVD